LVAVDGNNQNRMPRKISQRAARLWDQSGKRESQLATCSKIGLRWLICFAFIGLLVLLFIGRANAESPEDLEAKCKMLESSDFAGLVDAPTRVLSATSVKAGGNLPAYCEVTGYVVPNVGIKLGLPTHWNGKLMEMGCGGHCGMLDLVDAKYVSASCDVALRKGYACIVSNMGHDGMMGDALWGRNNLQAKVDWGFRATHVTAVAGKAIAERYYAQRPNRAYFMGCSTGGRQALQEAQRFPRDFNGIVAGAPPVNLSTVYMTFAWGIRATHDRSGKPLLGNDELKLLTAAAAAKCDLDDGVKDGVIADPSHCAFDPAELACKSDQARGCLTSEQIEAVKRVYAGPSTSGGTRLSLGGPLPGSEYPGWSVAYVGDHGKPAGYEVLATDGLRYLFFFPELDLAWKLSDFDFDRDSERLGVMEALYDSSNPDLRQFKSAGGKMMIYQGMADISVLPRATMDYYETVERTIGGRRETQSFLRLFLLPGVGHCLGGDGASAVDYLSSLEAWVEEGRAPEKLLSSHVKTDDLNLSDLDGFHKLVRRVEFPLNPAMIDFSRPVYPYPTMARYTGHGDPRNASNFGPVQSPSVPVAHGARANFAAR